MGSGVKVEDGVITCEDFNPRSPHGERPDCRIDQQCNLMISILAPRMGSGHNP